MATFIIDRQHQLNSDLVQLFHLDAQALIDHDRELDAARHLTSSRRHAAATAAGATKTTTTEKREDGGDHDDHNDGHSELLACLRRSIDAIDLRSASLPSMTKVLAELDKVAAVFETYPSARPPPSSSRRAGGGAGTYRQNSPSSLSNTTTTTTSSSSSTSRPTMLRRASSSLSSSLTTSSYFAEEATPPPPPAPVTTTSGGDRGKDKKNKGQGRSKADVDVDRVVERLETLFLAKCTVAVYLNLMNQLLNATLPLADEIDYWQGLLESSTWRSMYVIQTSPKRMYDLTKSVVIRTRQHVEYLVESSSQQQQQQQQSDPNHGQHLLRLLQHFPTLLAKQLVSRPVRFPDAIHYEIGNKKKQLQRIREYQAECLGLLAEQGLHLETVGRGLAMLRMESGGGVREHGHALQKKPGDGHEDDDDEEEAFVVEHVDAQVSRTIELMEQVLNKATNDVEDGCANVDQKDLGEKGNKGLRRSLTLIGRMRGVGGLPANEMYDHLRQLIHTSIPNYMAATERQAQHYHRPGWITRYWVPTLVGYFALKFGLQYVSDHRADLDEFLQEAYETARNFVQDYIWEPSKRIMAIIQHRDDQGSLQMLGNESLKSDIASLERMVIDFGKQHAHLSDEQLKAISEAVQNGDISIVMKAYEKELKTPLKGAVAGDLIQTLLIQVQKTKVDIEVAMAALDKLLKANELNFAFLAVGPSLLLLWFVTSQIRGTWRRARGQNLAVVSIQMRESLRQVERLLNLAATGVPPSRHLHGGGGGGMDDHSGKATKSTTASSSSSTQRPLKVRLATPMGTGTTVAPSGGRRGEAQSDSDTSDDVGSESQAKDAASVRALEKRVMASRVKKGKIPYKTQGLVLCEVHLLRTFARRLPRKDGLQDNVMQDLRELEESSLTVHQRLRTAARMYRTYGFLGLYH
ncbi:Nuclear control of ATPase protein 2 [Actinomortierella ambigua]|uniref:Nuclear control of ATPase protein 2 n=1 Tax=Actinomortierella ambigua TaxID=1343610 RepID=A0A9P6QHE0_9FUNG|nr:Nuclear control of ATPase protein 2 [Actinomortierella ambigua]